MPYRLIIFILICITTSLSSQESKPIEWVDCYLDHCLDSIQNDNIKFGYINVPQDYNQEDNSYYKLAFAVVKAKDTTTIKSPVMIFQGGWGMTNLNWIYAYANNFPIKDRDLILFDYRGSGYSEPQLCDWLGEETWTDILSDMNYEKFEQNQIKRFNRCLDSLEMKSIDYNLFGSNTKSHDIVLLAEALGYQHYNLFGISYGTRTILNFIRKARQSNITIDAAILDSNSPLGLEVHQSTMSTYYERSLTLVLSDCANDPKCNEAYPDIQERFESFLSEYQDNNLSVKLSNDEILRLNKEELNALIHQLLYSDLIYPYIPALLENIMELKGEFLSSIIDRPRDLVIQQYNGLGMVNYVYDHKYSQTKVDSFHRIKNTKENPYTMLDGYLRFFLSDNRISTDSLEAIPVQSNINALFLAGTYDPVTPPEWTQFVAEGFPNAQYIEANRIGHGVGPSSSCMESILVKYFDSPQDKIDASCITKLNKQPIVFGIDFYENPHVNKFVTSLVLDAKPILVVSIILIIISICIFLFRAIKKLIKLDFESISLIDLASILSTVYIIGLGSYIYGSYIDDPLIFIIGLKKGVNIFLFLAYPIFILTFFILITSIIRANRLKDTGVIVSLVAFSLLSFGIYYYQFLPIL